MPVPSGGAGQSKRRGWWSPALVATAARRAAEDRDGAADRDGAGGEGADRGGAAEDVTAVRRGPQPRPVASARREDVVRSKRKRRSIEKKLLATKRKAVFNLPSSTLIPLSQKVERPAWQFASRSSSEAPGNQTSCTCSAGIISLGLCKCG